MNARRRVGLPARRLRAPSQLRERSHQPLNNRIDITIGIATRRAPDELALEPVTFPFELARGAPKARQVVRTLFTHRRDERIDPAGDATKRDLDRDDVVRRTIVGPEQRAYLRGEPFRVEAIDALLNPVEHRGVEISPSGC